MTANLTPSLDFNLTDRDFSVIVGLAKETCGIHLDPAKRALVHARLARRVRALGLRDFADYCRLLQTPSGRRERQQMLAALTTNVTHFFREAHHFTELAKIIPSLLDRAREGGRIRLWSAGCSTGQEPYSIAAAVLESCPEADRFDFRILATDVDRAVLARAEAGRYQAEDIAALPSARRISLFGLDASSGMVRPELRRLVTFRPLNLTGDWPMAGSFDVIFCRNVAIYFDSPTRQRLWARLADRLRSGGILFIGHSERVTGPAKELLVNSGVTSYRRRGTTPADAREELWD